jgi:hypothetical protein
VGDGPPDASVESRKEFTMIARQPYRWLGYLVGFVVVMAVGCRDTEPTPSHYTDLGRGDRILLPSASPWCKAEIGEDGRAEWVPFREPNFDEVAEEPEEGGEPEGDEAGEIEAEIRELIDDYNKVAADKDLEGLLEYHVEAQLETIEAAFNAVTTVLEKLEALRAALAEKLPDETERIDAAFDLLERGASGELVVDSVTVIGDNEVTAKLAAGSSIREIRFLVIDDDWFLEFVDLPDASQVTAQSDVLLSTFDGLLQGLQSGQVPADTLLTQIETMAAAAAAAAREDQEAEPDDETEDEETEEDSGG